jgi:hypothetical protein
MSVSPYEQLSFSDSSFSKLLHFSAKKFWNHDLHMLTATDVVTFDLHNLAKIFFTCNSTPENISKQNLGQNLKEFCDILE